QDGVIPATDDTWRTMAEQTARLRRLVDDIDAVSRAEERPVSIATEPVDVAGVVTEALAAVSAAFAAKHVTLQPQCGSLPIRVAGDPDRLGEILDNLLSNALRHTPPGGRVTVTCRGGTGATEVSVADTGEGVAAEHLPYLFDRFYRADPAR